MNCFEEKEYKTYVSIECTLLLEEKQELLQIVERGSGVEDRVYVGAYLLLDNQDAAETHLNNMDKETQDIMRSYPIWKFWKQM